MCDIWNLHREKLYPSGSSDLVLHSSINQCVVNGRDAMAAHSRDIYLLIIIIFIGLCINNFGTYLYVAATFLTGSSKAALDMLTKVMGLELGQYNVSIELPL